MFRRFQLAMAAAVFCITFGSLYASAKDNLAGWAVSDLTGTLELASVEENSPMWTVTIRNRSNAVVTAASVAFKAEAHYYQDWLNAEPSGLAPGRTFDITISAEDGSTRKVKLSAVIFDDGSGKGDPVQLEIMNCHRFGQMLESARIKEILRSRDSSGNDSSIDILTRKVGKMPLSADDAFQLRNEGL